MSTAVQTSFRLLAAFAFLSLANAVGLAQSQTPAAPPAEAGRLVTLNVRVTDNLSHAVVDVDQDAFTVTEDGVAQKITGFSKEVVPLSYGLVIDNSGSLRTQLKTVMQTGAKIVSSNKEDDEAFIIRFISSDKIEIVQEFTFEKRLLLDGLSSLYVEGGTTALVDAVYLAADKIGKRQFEGRLRRRALIVITDGEDRSSFYSQDKLFALLAKNDIQIYVIGFTRNLDRKAETRAIDFLSRLATETGGRVFFPQNLSELTHIADEIVSDIRTQYVISYVPIGTDVNKPFHKVLVSIANNPDQGRRVAVTRVGYSTPVQK